MSTRCFVTIIALAVSLFIISVLVPVASIAESTYTRQAVVIGYSIAYSDCFEVEAVDENGASWMYYSNIEDAICIGDIVVLTIRNSRNIEDHEIIDIDLIGRLNIREVIEYLDN